MSDVKRKKLELEYIQFRITPAVKSRLESLANADGVPTRKKAEDALKVGLSALLLPQTDENIIMIRNMVRAAGFEPAPLKKAA